MTDSDWKNETKLLQNILAILKSPDRNSRYRQALKSDTELTEFISDVNAKLACQMGMFHFHEYYTIDHVLYRDEDCIPEGEQPLGTSRVKGTWLNRIRVAFEHENHLDSAGGFQEIAKLILVNADLKVLMGWEDKTKDYDPFAREYQRIYESADPPESAMPILFIGENLNTRVDGYLITVNGLLKYHTTAGWQAMQNND